MNQTFDFLELGENLDRPVPAASETRARWWRRYLLAVFAASRTTLLSGILLSALLILFLWGRIVYVVPAGYAGVLYLTFFGGTQTDYVYGEGLHVFFPWDRFTLYEVKVQVVTTDFTVLTNKGLPIELKLFIRFHPEYDTVGLLHQKVGPDYVTKIVVPQVESVLRRNLGKEEPEAIYTNKEGVLTKIVSRAIEEISERFVTVDDIIIRQVILPEQVRAAVDAKLVSQQQAEAYEFRNQAEKLEAERKRIEAEGIKVSQEIIASTLTPELLSWLNIKSQTELAKSNNAKVIVMNPSTPLNMLVTEPTAKLSQ